MKAYKVKSKTREITFNVEEYGSAHELVTTNSNREITDAWKDDSLKKDDIRMNWHGVESYDKALNLLRNGWSDNVDKLKTLTGKVSTQMNGKRISFQNNVVGFAPIVPLAMMNVPNSMIDTRIKPMKSKVVKILYNLTMSSCTDPEKILENGMKVIKAVMNLENSGYRCEIVSMQTYYSDDYCDTLMLKIKEANQPLDLKRIMFPMIHPAMFRVIGFDWQDKLPTGKYIRSRGKAIGYELKSRTSQIVKEAFGDNCFYLDGTIIKDNDDDYIERLLKGEVD